MFTINKSAHAKKKSGNLFNAPRSMKFEFPITPITLDNNFLLFECCLDFCK